MAKPAREIDDPALVFLQTLWALAHCLQSHSKRMKSTTGVTGPQRLVLRLIALHPKISPSDVARLLSIHKSTVTVVLRNLEGARLVRRIPNPEDGRGYLLSLTPRGEAIAKKKSGAVESVVRSVLARTAASDVRATKKTLESLTQALST